MVEPLTDRAARADVAVVLGCRVYADGTPSPKLKARLERALEVWRRGLVSAVIVSGDGAAREGVDEAAVMKRWLVAHGLPEVAVFEDAGGVNTRATALNTAAWMSRNQAVSVIAVSQYFHLPRTRLALRQAGLAQVHVAGADRFKWRDLPNIVREVAAYAKYLVAR